MKDMTYEGTVENGCVHLAAGVSLPENAKVYVVVPGTNENGGRHVVHIPTPRLKNPEHAKFFVKEVFDLKEES